MKIFSIVIIAFFMLSNIIHAENTIISKTQKEVVSIELSIQKVNTQESVRMELNKIDDFKAFEGQLDNLFDLPNEDCTVSVSVTVSVGVVSVTLTAENIPCDKVGTTIRRLYDTAKEAIN